MEKAGNTRPICAEGNFCGSNDNPRQRNKESPTKNNNGIKRHLFINSCSYNADHSWLTSRPLTSIIHHPKSTAQMVYNKFEQTKPCRLAAPPTQCTHHETDLHQLQIRSSPYALHHKYAFPDKWFSHSRLDEW